jgi:hypothetical protein
MSASPSPAVSTMRKTRKVVSVQGVIDARCENRCGFNTPVCYSCGMQEMPCSTPGCSRRVPADSKIHRIVLHDPGTRVLGVLYYCSPCLEHFASYGPYGHFAPRYGATPTPHQQSLAEWSAWVDELLEEDI